MEKHIAVIPGDGIGPENAPNKAVKVLVKTLSLSEPLRPEKSCARCVVRVAIAFL